MIVDISYELNMQIFFCKWQFGVLLVTLYFPLFTSSKDQSLSLSPFVFNITQ